MNTKRHFTAEFKAKIVRQILAEEQTINQLAAEQVVLQEMEAVGS